MPSGDIPLNKAHQHASNAEEYINQGLFIPAAEEHYKSAEAFLQCVEQAGDEGTKRTLRMLYNEHSKAGKELQRKINKLKEEGKDPSLPQVQLSMPSERTYAPPPSAGARTTSYPSSRGRLSDSNNTIDESYMVLGQQSDHAFGEFWKVFEGMLENLSQPVAFATAPLPHTKPSGVQTSSQSTLENSAIRRDGSSSSDDMNFTVGFVPKYNGRTLGLGQPGRDVHRPRSATTQSTNPHRRMQATVVSEGRDNSDPEEVLADPDSPSGESFFMIPSASEASTSKLQKENASLKSEIESLQQRLDIAERMRLEQEQQIREGIRQARREAQRVMNSSYLPQRPIQPVVDLSSLNLNIPPVSSLSGPSHTGNRDREAHLIRKVKELEEEVKTVQAENEKQKAMIVKFRERWEKLKESAKRKRNAKANAGLESIRDQRIDEDPEAEAEVEAEAET